EKVKETWKTLTEKCGNFKKQGAAREQKSGKYDIVFVACEFEKFTLDARVVFDADKKIAGLAFTPATTAEYKAPAYVKRDAFKQVEATVGPGGWALPATLALPLGDGPFRAVVLVHGSGPQDRDETILANRPFRDLAWGLASRGIAVLRYEKRTREHSLKLA